MRPAFIIGATGKFMTDLLVKKVLDALPLGVILFDADLKIIAANQSAGNLINITDSIDQSLAKDASTGDPYSQHVWSEKLKGLLATGQCHSFETGCYTHNGKNYLLRLICAPLPETETAKSANRGLLILEDITEHVRLHNELANAERLATLGKLTSKIAHELNGPIDGILRYISLALRSVEKEGLDKPKEYLTRCQQGLMRMVYIVSELLEFSRGSRAQTEYAQVEHIVEEAINIMSAKIEITQIQIVRNYAVNLPQLRAGNLFQVFCNIVKNAFESMPNGGELHISTYLSPDGAVAVEFRDTGIGIPSENIESIFRPFFTTKEKGTGLGLSICRDIVEQHHGRITAENGPDIGSIFTVYLPVTTEP
jgi:signal transduction histidine kinase